MEQAESVFYCQLFLASQEFLKTYFTLLSFFLFSGKFMRQAETCGMGISGVIPSTVHHSSRSWSELFMLEGGGVFLNWNKS